MKHSVDWPSEFKRIIACDVCKTSENRGLLRDADENVPQPGYVGGNYWNQRVLLIGQNPGAPERFSEADKKYSQALRALRDSPTGENYGALSFILSELIPGWRVHGQYFPLQEAGLKLDEIAYFNLVRCRTVKNGAPRVDLVRACMTNHLGRWLCALKPRVVVFIGKWAFDRAALEVSRRGIPNTFVNRSRSLSVDGRNENRSAVVKLISSCRT